MIKRAQLTRFRKNEEAAVAIEFAFLAPALVLMAVGVLEFGTYFLRSQSAHNAVAATMTAVQADPTDSSNRDLLRANFTDYRNSRNFGCARPFRTQAEANNGVCRAGVWNTNPPRNHEGDYYVLLRSHIAASSTTRLFDALIPETNIRQVIRVSQNAQGNCDESELRRLACVITKESYQINQSRSLIQNSSDGDHFSSSASVVSSRTVTLEPPQCTTDGWNCDYYESINNPGPGQGTVTYFVGSYVHEIDISRTRSVELMEQNRAPASCSYSTSFRNTRNSARSYQGCWSGKALPSQRIRVGATNRLSVRAF